jgi:hypothetical protein
VERRDKPHSPSVVSTGEERTCEVRQYPFAILNSP